MVNILKFPSFFQRHRLPTIAGVVIPQGVDWKKISAFIGEKYVVCLYGIAFFGFSCCIQNFLIFLIQHLLGNTLCSNELMQCYRTKKPKVDCIFPGLLHQF